MSTAKNRAIPEEDARILVKLLRLQLGSVGRRILELSEELREPDGPVLVSPLPAPTESI
jgi:hypothetical protein